MNENEKNNSNPNTYKGDLLSIWNVKNLFMKPIKDLE